MNRELKDRISYQLNTPRVTTMGNCANGCGRISRGSATCADCLAGDDPEARALVVQLRRAAVERFEAEDDERSGRA